MYALRAGLLLGLVELVVVVATGRTLFLSLWEWSRYALLAFSALPVLTLGLGAVGSRVVGALRSATTAPRVFERRLRRVVFVVGCPCLVLLAWLLSAGRRVRDVPGRTLVCLALSAALAWLLAELAVRMSRLERGSQRAELTGRVLYFACALAVALDATVLKRLYPAFHLGLGAVAVGAALCGSACALREPERGGDFRWLRVSTVLAAFAAASLFSLATASNARFAIVQSAPLSGRLLRMLPARQLPEPNAVPWSLEAPVSAPSTTGPSPIDLRGRDVLLITVDALRADQLAAYGGTGNTPALDALARESAIFTRAYTPTPHTSYALSSLLTGKFTKPLLALDRGRADHTTLPELLRRFGYRTAAFYPPAIFFVDGERFASLQRKQFGFEYVKVMYAPAAQRVLQLQDYLQQAPRDHPLFVWMHLFEPHEPYEPPPEFARGGSPRERYAGEVAAADAAVRDLVEVFRRERAAATVIVTADHGEEFGDHGGAYHGTTLFDEQVRVPLLWSSPGSVTPHRIATPVELIDVTTTLLAALRIPRDARMRGDDLSATLAGAPGDTRGRAFSSLDDERMWTDGRMKLICGEDGCRLFDLSTDPTELRDVARERERDVARLRAEMAGLLASLPRVEALAMDGGGAWPEALARARLGDRTVGAELLPLLNNPRPHVRAAAARGMAELDAVQGAALRLTWMRTWDADADVRNEAALAALRHGALEAREQVLPWLTQPSFVLPFELRLRAALALAQHGDGAGAPLLTEAARDAALDEASRVAALRALALVGDSRCGQRLIALLADVRLRTHVAEALGRLGGDEVVPALVAALEQERYPQSRSAEAQALLRLGARREAIDATRRFLGTESSIPDGVALLQQAGALTPASAAGGVLPDALALRTGPWRCDARACRPLPGARLRLPLKSAAGTHARLVLRLHSTSATPAALRVAGRAYPVQPGSSELSLPAATPTELMLDADPGVAIEAFARVAVRDDVSPPAPEPW